MSTSGQTDGERKVLLLDSSVFTGRGRVTNRPMAGLYSAEGLFIAYFKGVAPQEGELVIIRRCHSVDPRELEWEIVYDEDE